VSPLLVYERVVVKSHLAVARIKINFCICGRKVKLALRCMHSAVYGAVLSGRQPDMKVNTALHMVTHLAKDKGVPIPHFVCPFIIGYDH
jgi:hypothetical protein